MKDTHPKMEKLFHELMMQKTPAERMNMGFSMFESAKELVEASIRHENPNISDNELRKQTFLRFYKNDFTPEQLAKILPKLKF